ncbi:MAG: 30S ribosomal protein S12 methylthiotransferase RimO [Sedimentisphaerales bacterium]|nr:30S ribosomal protein S12 methylthiotransferase RimO [Sedimentisphaerales bacterium]
MLDNLITINFVALGCPKNLVDSEKMLGLIVENGIAIVSPDDQADATLINTCGFIESARQEAYEHIEAALEAKANGDVNYVIVVGCLAQYYASKLIDRYPEIDAVVGLTERDNIPNIIRDLVTADSPNPSPIVITHPSHGITNDQARLRITEPYRAYLRISEGCSQGCAFCSIPRIRGPFRSKPLQTVLDEAQELVADGVTELTIIGQETTSYGQDLTPKATLAQILQQLDQLCDLRWVRLLYAHPASLTDEIIDAIAQCEKTLPYIDLPLQHINDRMLKLMNRHIDRAGCENRIQKLRQAIPNITIRTTMLVGFPSETDAEFNELLEFVRQTRFDALGTFAYSREQGTAADKLAPQVPEEIKQQRLQTLMLAQQEIAFDIADSLVGKTLSCIVNQELDPKSILTFKPAKKKKWYLARHQGQAPEIDTETFLCAPKQTEIIPGQIVKAKITQRAEYDLVGEITN